MAERDARIDRLLLAQEITDFLYREAELLDERRYREWQIETGIHWAEEPRSRLSHLEEDDRVPPPRA